MASVSALPAELQRSIIFRGAEVMKVPASAFVAPDARQLQVLTRDKLATVKSEILGVADPKDVYFLCYWKAKSGLFGRSGSRKALPLSNIREVRRGASSTVFRKAKGSGIAITDDNQCFSVHSSERTLDWICWSDDDCAEWISGLNSLIALVASASGPAAAPRGAPAVTLTSAIAAAPPLPPSAPPAVDEYRGGRFAAVAAAAYDDHDDEALPDDRGTGAAGSAPAQLHRTGSGRDASAAVGAARSSFSSAMPRVDARSSSSAAASAPPAPSSASYGGTSGGVRSAGAAPPALPGNRHSASSSAAVLPAASSSSHGAAAAATRSRSSSSGIAAQQSSQQALGAAQPAVTLRTGVAWDAAARQRYFERTAFDAISGRKEEELVFALEDGCDLELRNPDSHRTLLQHACAVGAHKIVRALLQRGAEFDPNRDPASDALALAVACGHFLAASEIIAVADNTPRLTVQLCNMRRGAGQDTLLHMACRAQSPAIARLLLEKSLNPLFACNAVGRSPLLEACAPCVIALKDRQDIMMPSPRKGNAAAAARARGAVGASVSPVSSAAMAREAAAEAARQASIADQVHRAQLDVARELLERGAGDAVELADAAGDTALHLAAALSCNPALVQLLLESGADACAVNDAGLTPADALIRAGASGRSSGSSRFPAGDAIDVIEKLSEYGGPPSDEAAAAALAAAAAAGAPRGAGARAGAAPGATAQGRGGTALPAASPDAGDFHTPAADRTDARFRRNGLADHDDDVDDGDDDAYDPALAGATTRQSPPAHDIDGDDAGDAGSGGFDFDDAGVVAGAGGLTPPMQGGGRAAWMTVQKAKEQQASTQRTAQAHALGLAPVAAVAVAIDSRGAATAGGAFASIDGGAGGGGAELSPMRLARQQQLRRRPSGTDALVQTAKDLGFDAAAGRAAGTEAVASGVAGSSSGDSGAVDTASAAAFAQLSEAEQAEQQAAWLQYIYDVTHAGYVRPWTLSYDEAHGAYFFFHEESGESAWEPPPDVVAAITALAYSGDGSGAGEGGEAGSVAAVDGSMVSEVLAGRASPSGTAAAGASAAGTASAPARMAAVAAAGAAGAAVTSTHGAVETVEVLGDVTAGPGGAVPRSTVPAAAAGRGSIPASGLAMPAGAVSSARTITSPPMPPPPNVARINVGGRLAFGSPAKIGLLSPQRAAARVALVSPQRVLQGGAASGPAAASGASASSGVAVPSLPLSRLANGDAGLGLGAGLQTLAANSPRSLPASARQADGASASGETAAASAAAQPSAAPAESHAAAAPVAAVGSAAPSAAAPNPHAAASAASAASVAAASAAAAAAQAVAAAAESAHLRDRLIAQLRSGAPPPLEVWRRMALELVSPDLVRELQAAVAAHSAAGRPIATLLMDSSADAAAIAAAAQTAAAAKSGAASAAAAAPVPTPTPKPAPAAQIHDEKYVKMLRMGVPGGAVWGRMTADGKPAAEIKALEVALAQYASSGAPMAAFLKDNVSAASSSGDNAGAAGGAGTAAATATAAAPPAHSHDEKFVKMLRMGVPGGAVWGRMAADGKSQQEIAALEAAVKAHAASGASMADFLKGAAANAAAPSAAASASAGAAASAAGSENSAAPSADARKAALEVVSSEPRFAKYGAMKKMGVPLGAIKGQMGADGLAKEDVALFLRAHATAAALESMQLLTPDKKKDGAGGDDAAKAGGSGAAAAAAGGVGGPAAAPAAAAAAAAGPTTLKLHWDPLELDESTMQNTVWGRLRQKAAAAAAGAGRGGALAASGILSAAGDAAAAAASEEASLITTLFAAKAAAAPAKGAGKDGAGAAGGAGGKDGDGGAGSASASTVTSPSSITTLDPRRANNLNILLAQFKRFPDHAAICSAVYALTSGPLNRDALEKLSQLIPKPDELRAVRGYKGEPDRLMECDRFFLAISRVPRFPTKVASFITLLSAADIAGDVLRRASLVRDACAQVVASETLQVVLAQVLAVGNLLNAGHSRLTARAITLESLLKLSSTKAADRKTSLMDALVMTLMSKAASSSGSGSGSGGAAGGAGGSGAGDDASPASSSSSASLDLGAELSLLSEARRLEVTEIASDFKQLSTALAAALREAEAEAADLQKEADAAAKASAAPPPVPAAAGAGGAAAAAGGGGGPMARNSMLAEMMAKRAAAAAGGAAPAPAAAAAPPPVPSTSAAGAAAGPIVATKPSASSNPCSRTDRQHFVDELRAFARAQQSPVAALQAAVAAADAGLKEVSAYFGEDPAKATCGGLLGTLQQFVIDFGAAQRRVRATQAQQAKAAALGASQTLGSSMRRL